MSGIDITEYVRVQSICAGNGIVLENKIKENERKNIKKGKKELAFEDTFFYELWQVHNGIKKIEEKTTK